MVTVRNQGDRTAYISSVSIGYDWNEGSSGGAGVMTSSLSRQQESAVKAWVGDVSTVPASIEPGN